LITKTNTVSSITVFLIWIIGNVYFTNSFTLLFYLFIFCFGCLSIDFIFNLLKNGKLLWRTYTVETYKSLQGKSLQNFKSLRFLVIFPMIFQKITYRWFKKNNFKSLRFFETFFVTIYTSRLYVILGHVALELKYKLNHKCV